MDKAANMQKIAVVVFADLNDSHADLARVTNALQIVQEFKEAGDDVRLLFDGGGTASIAAIAQPDHRMHKAYESVQDRVIGACAFCARAFHVKEALESAGVPLLADYKLHPSIRSLVVEGYEIITL